MPIRLGVSIIDDDHAALGRLFGSVAATPDAELAGLFERIAAELAAHFTREEQAMTEARAPILLMHIELRQQLMIEIARMRRAIADDGPEVGRQLLGTLLPLLIAQHIATADAVSASFLRRQRD